MTGYSGESVIAAFRVAAEAPTVNYHLKESGCLIKGATGSPARTLAQLALNLADGAAVS